jgi:hypothetical protein
VQLLAGADISEELRGQPAETYATRPNKTGQQGSFHVSLSSVQSGQARQVSDSSRIKSVLIFDEQQYGKHYSKELCRRSFSTASPLLSGGNPLNQLITSRH